MSEPLLPQLHGKTVSIWYQNGWTASGEVEHVDDFSVTLSTDDRLIMIPRHQIRSVKWKRGES